MLLTNPPGLEKGFTGNFYDYRRVVISSLTRPEPAYRLLRGVMPSWDNTARRLAGANIWLHASPELYEAWLSALVAQTSQKPDPEDRLIFINAWNEWAEGCHLEPDEKHGYRHLEATQRALRLPEAAGASINWPRQRTICEATTRLNNGDWFKWLLKSLDGEEVNGFHLPLFPEAQLQIGTVGSAGETALREVLPFYETIKAKSAVPVDPAIAHEPHPGFRHRLGAYPPLFPQGHQSGEPVRHRRRSHANPGL